MANVNKDQAIRVEVIDPETGKVTIEYIYELRPVKSGMLARIVGSGYNVYRNWEATKWMTNVTSSSRFNLETNGMTQKEIGVYVKFLDQERAARLAAR